MTKAQKEISWFNIIALLCCFGLSRCDYPMVTMGFALIIITIDFFSLQFLYPAFQARLKGFHTDVASVTRALNEYEATLNEQIELFKPMIARIAEFPYSRMDKSPVLMGLMMADVADNICRRQYQLAGARETIANCQALADQSSPWHSQNLNAAISALCWEPRQYKPNPADATWAGYFSLGGLNPESFELYPPCRLVDYGTWEQSFKGGVVEPIKKLQKLLA